MNKIIFKINDNYEQRIKDVIVNSSISELNTFLRMLPGNKRFSSFDLQDYGFSYENIFYKECARLDKDNSLEKNKREEFQRALYNYYLYIVYNNEYPTFEEFKTFSNLMVTAFDDYNPNIKRKGDNHPFVASDGDEFISNLVNSIAYNYRHTEHPHAFELDYSKWTIVKNILKERKEYLIEENLKKSLESEEHYKYVNSMDFPEDKKNMIKRLLKK